MNRPIQVKPADSESRGGTVRPLFFFPPVSFVAPTFVPLPFSKKKRKSTLPARINLTIIRAISRCPPPQLGLTAQPGQTLHCSERIMLTPLFPWLARTPSPRLPACLLVRVCARATCRAETCVPCPARAGGKLISFTKKINKKKKHKTGDAPLLLRHNLVWLVSYQLGCSSQPVLGECVRSDRTRGAGWAGLRRRLREIYRK